nr:SDR family NAD(P)-dependent oxidoreductase [Legionella tunisiensis]
MNLDNQIAVITGGASGMGKACAQALAARGVRVVIWDKQIEAGAAKEFAFAVACDVSSAEEIERALQNNRTNRCAKNLYQLCWDSTC